MVKGKMAHIGVGLVCALLLLIQYGNGATVNITSPNLKQHLLTGDTINLTISYSSTPSLIVWTVNDNLVAAWINGESSITGKYNNRLTLQENQISIRDSTPADSGDYLVLVTDANGDTGDITFNVVVRDRVPEIQSDDTGIFKTGQNISLTISYTGEPLGIVWKYNGSPLIVSLNGRIIVGDRFKGRANITDNGSLLVHNTTNEDAGTYTITVTSNVSSASRSFQVKFYDVIIGVTVQQTPAIIIESTPDVNLSCTASSGFGSVTWQKDGQPLTNDSSHVLLDQALQILNPKRTSSGTYSCSMSNPISSSVGFIVMTVYYPVEEVTVTQSPEIVSEMTPLVNLSCSAARGLSETVTWMKDGQSIINDDKHNLLDGNRILQIIQPNRTFIGTYSCNMSNPAYWDSGSLYLFVYDPVVNVKVTQSPGIVSESTSLVELSCSASSGYIESVTWTKEGKPITNNGNYNLLDGNKILRIMQPNRTFSGLYRCNMSNTVYWNTGSLQLRVYDPVEEVTVTQSPEIVSEMTPLVNLTCSAARGLSETVTWMKDGQSIINDDKHNLLDGNRILQIIQPNRTFIGTYSCNMSNPAYWGLGFLYLFVYDPVVNVKVTQSPGIVSESTDLVALSCSASSGYIESVTWMKEEMPITNNDKYYLLDGNKTLKIMQPNRTFSGLYRCNISNAVYRDTGSLQLRVYDPVENVLVTQSPKTLDGNSTAVNLSCIGSSTYVEAVKWTKDGESIEGNDTFTLLDGNRTLQIIDSKRTFGGLYYCIVSNAAYQKIVSHRVLIYDPIWTVTMTQLPKIASESSPAVNLSCGASSGYIESVTWMKDEKPITNNDSYNLLNDNRILQINKPNKTFSGLYSCKMSNAAYWNSVSLQLHVYDPVSNVKVTQSPDKVTVGTPSVTLTCSGSGAYIEKVTWTKDGKTVSSENPYSLSEGDKVLQITKPATTHSGIYTCNMSNAAYWGSGDKDLSVSGATPGATATFGLMIITLLGGLLLAH